MINHPNRRRAAAKRKISTAPVESHDHDYSALLESLQRSFNVAAAEGPLFATDAADLNELYLDSLPGERQFHNCSCCRRFLEAYGGLVTVGLGNTLVPAMWTVPGVSDFYDPVFEALHARVRKARIVAPFLSKLSVWGTPETAPWTHMAVHVPREIAYRERVLTAGQAMAAAKENFRIVATALVDFKSPMLDEALRILGADALARSEKFIGPVKWLRTLQDRPKGKLGENALWKAIATAPDGYCHPRASMVGPLLEDIAAGLPFADIKARFDAKMHPLRYQRPQAPPSAGNIKAAEALAEKMGIAPSLERRFARLEDIPEREHVWKPSVVEAAAAKSGVFGHLKAKNADTVRPVDMPASTMTWDKFARTVIPAAEQMQIHVPSNGRFIALTTAVHDDAPAVLKWDRDDARNPVAWYVYPSGSPAHQWGLTAGSWANISAIAPFPNQWGDKPMPFLAEGVILLIEGSADSRVGSGNALFPECLREEMHAVRSTIEAYSRSAVMAGRAEASACGYDVRKSSADCNLRVLAKGAWNSYRIDRWD